MIHDESIRNAEQINSHIVIPHLYAWKSAKWINGLEFLDNEELGFWERNGYHKRGEPWSEERYGSI